MPSAQMVSSFISNNFIKKIGKMPNSDDTTVDKFISQTCRVQRKFSHIQVEITDNGTINFAGAHRSITFNGSYLFFEVETTTVATLDHNRTIVVSGGYGGCLYRVYKNHSAEFICAHISRDEAQKGLHPDALVNLMDGYAAQQKWTILHSLPTKGQVGAGNQGFTLTHLTPNRKVISFLLVADGQGNVTVKSQVTSDA